MAWPEPIDVVSTPSIIGTSRSPEPVGVAASTVWKYSGRNVTAPNSAKPTISDSTPATENTRSRHSAGGRIGSGARRSANTKTVSATTPKPPTITVGDEPQAQVVPPSDVTSTTPLRPAASSAAPT